MNRSKDQLEATLRVIKEGRKSNNFSPHKSEAFGRWLDYIEATLKKQLENLKVETK